ncbi:MAG: rhodanese-like domain-containing protein [Ardenticatenaceae bacterium]|nr:rhodanese-like domain-containing protein [Anaerolineales bacterium]MCB8923887.1 rhodanese-like domain-containing protein [Ardenticatenaceae bacterium]MCB8990468.1 rhodanese-like domain-containing protein [Ardenticatenaceae bacterium]MCB9003482.1 rhodanese-like domain-containing protein [Ardenticatenaceae bacterium]
MSIFDWLFGPKARQISVQEAYVLLQNANPPLIVDVRQLVETKDGIVAGAIVIPLTEFGERYAELPPEQQILTICRSSHRSPLAARRLLKAGYQVLDVQGGMIAWQEAGLPVQTANTDQ